MKKIRILFVGHDLKFMHRLLMHFSMRSDCEVRTHTYSGHLISGTEKIVPMLPKTDIVFCEWGLGNLVWFSRNKLPGQLLIVRIHAQEFYTCFLDDTQWENVDRIIFVSDHMMRRFIERYPGIADKCVVIKNMVDGGHFDREKTGDAVFHIGMLGVLPKLKAPHKALEILQELKKSDNRFKLFIKGRKPDELSWLIRKQDEREYYERFDAMISEMGLSGDVSWEPQGDDVAEWFQKIGFILSCSDHESFQNSIAGGMASGAIPVIMNWEGAEELYPAKFIYTSIGEAVHLVGTYSIPERFAVVSAEVKKYCAEHFPVTETLAMFDEQMIPLAADLDEIRQAFQKLAAGRDQLEAHARMLEEENRTLQEQKNQILRTIEDLTAEMNHIRNTCAETEARLTAIQHSMTWKAGSLLIRKPADLLMKLIHVMKNQTH